MHLKTPRSTAVTAVFQRAVVVNSRAVPVPWKVAKNCRRNGHGRQPYQRPPDEKHFPDSDGGLTWNYSK
jgi:hypothetical protein